jgi:hypothetical protein
MDWKSKFQAGRDSGQEKLNQQAEKVIDEQWPRIQQLFQEKAGPAVIAAVHDDARMESLFKMVYAAMCRFRSVWWCKSRCSSRSALPTASNCCPISPQR